MTDFPIKKDRDIVSDSGELCEDGVITEVVVAIDWIDPASDVWGAVTQTQDILKEILNRRLID